SHNQTREFAPRANGSCQMNSHAGNSALVNQPASILIFGASGDLTARKIIPALFQLAQEEFLPANCPIVGVARREKSDAEFRAEMREAVSQFARTKPVTDDDWSRF